MAYQLLPNIILLLSLLGVIILVLRRLPEASNLDDEEAEAHAEPQRLMEAKGLPARAASRGRAVLKVGTKRVWDFMLEAKGLRHDASVNYKIKKIWRRRPASPSSAPIAPASSGSSGAFNEEHYLQQIKKFPKDLEQYNKLGQYYLDQKNYEEARNVYDYLVKHSPATSEYLAKLGYSCLHLRQYDQAVESYDKSLRLDSSHPNRYYNLALAYNALGQRNEAVEALDKALSLEPTNKKYLQGLAENYEKIGQQDKADAIYKEIERI